jgi:hypothetical protein
MSTTAAATAATTTKQQQYQLLPYGYIFYYAARYDALWITLTHQLLLLLRSHNHNHHHHQQRTTKHKKIDHFTRLSDETCWEVCRFLDAASLLAMAQVCPYFNKICNRTDLWVTLLHTTFKLSIDTLEERQYFQHHHQQQQNKKLKQRRQQHRDEKENNNIATSTATAAAAGATSVAAIPDQWNASKRMYREMRYVLSQNLIIFLLIS